MLASPARVRFGQVLLLLVHVVFLCGVGYVLTEAMTADAATFPDSQRRQILASAFGATILVTTLGVLMWNGYGWPRWIQSLLFFAGALLLLPLIEMPEFGSRGLIALGSVLLVILSATLAFVAPIEDFIRHRERLRRLNQ
jgi:hypothetical protein